MDSPQASQTSSLLLSQLLVWRFGIEESFAGLRLLDVQNWCAVAQGFA